VREKENREAIQTMKIMWDAPTKLKLKLRLWQKKGPGGAGHCRHWGETLQKKEN